MNMHCNYKLSGQYVYMLWYLIECAQMVVNKLLLQYQRIDLSLLWQTVFINLWHIQRDASILSYAIPL